MNDTNKEPLGRLGTQFFTVLNIKCAVCEIEYDAPPPKKTGETFRDWAISVQKQALDDGWKEFRKEDAICPSCDSGETSWIDIQLRGHKTSSTNQSGWWAKRRQK